MIGLLGLIIACSPAAVPSGSGGSGAPASAVATSSLPGSEAPPIQAPRADDATLTLARRALRSAWADPMQLAMNERFAPEAVAVLGSRLRDDARSTGWPSACADVRVDEGTTVFWDPAAPGSDPRPASPGWTPDDPGQSDRDSCVVVEFDAASSMALHALVGVEPPVVVLRVWEAPGPLRPFWGRTESQVTAGVCRERCGWGDLPMALCLGVCDRMSTTPALADRVRSPVQRGLRVADGGEGAATVASLVAESSVQGWGAAELLQVLGPSSEPDALAWRFVEGGVWRFILIKGFVDRAEHDAP